MKRLLFLFYLAISQFAFSQTTTNFAFQNTSLSFDERVNDLVSRLTLEEKVAQMLNATPAIPRLGIPAYEWWNEVLHGVARTKFKVTVFPQAIAMAATFDTASLAKMAHYSALEGRAIFNETSKTGKSGQRYVGLTYWTPNINIFRDPRWGRGQETYGEDPYLTETLGKTFVQSLQGNDPKYLKAAACAKHYAVHSGPEPLRHSFDVKVSDYDLWNTYLPAFKTLSDAGVAGFMCAYNAYDKQPCCGSDLLMNDILRNRWKFTGYVTSDCSGIDDFFKHHKTHKNAQEASVDAVLHSTDLECGRNAYFSLVNAVKEGKITEEQINISVRRLFMIRFRLGMFDPPSMVKYAETPLSVIESPQHKAHALKMAQQSIVLLKNENNTLPFSKKMKKIAIVGPNADDSFTVLGNYNGTPSNKVTVLAGIKNKLGNSCEVVYEKALNHTTNVLMIPFLDFYSNCSFEGKNGVKAEYFNNILLEGSPALVRFENKIDNSWQEGEIVGGTISATNFSARYTSTYQASKSEEIVFAIEGDDKYKFSVNGEVVVDAFTKKMIGSRNYTLKVEANKMYLLTVEYVQLEGKGSILMSAGKNIQTDFNEVANRLKDVDAIVFVGGITPKLEGEEGGSMNFTIPGFSKGDRTSILLPVAQTEMMKAVKLIGKPIAFVMMTGSAVSIPWENENVPAIINAWYGGQDAGAAVADVLFGDYNPAGRLPITFYQNDSDLPSFENYDMKNRTYRYFIGEALYPFGYGLSYSTFVYRNLKLKKENSKVVVNVDVTNNGKMSGEEVVQLYVSYKEPIENNPIRSLKNYQRITLQSGETKQLEIILSNDAFTRFDNNGKPEVLSGKYEISVGGGQPDMKIKATSNVLKTELSL